MEKAGYAARTLSASTYPRLPLVAFTLIRLPFIPILALAASTGSTTVSRAPVFSVDTTEVEVDAAL